MKEIARYKVPKYVLIVDEFPLTHSGKIQKFKLKEQAVELLEKRKKEEEEIWNVSFLSTLFLLRLR